MVFVRRRPQRVELSLGKKKRRKKKGLYDTCGDVWEEVKGEGEILFNEYLMKIINESITTRHCCFSTVFKFSDLLGRRF